MFFDITVTIPNVKDFRWSEALYLRQWQIHVIPGRDAQSAIQRMALVLQLVRDYFGRPVKIHSWLRPPRYNELIGGKPKSYHIKGEAVDFSVLGITCLDIHRFLEPRLDELQIRMKHEFSNYVHVDCGEPGISGRYFIA